jgi:hypothetical protein
MIDISRPNFLTQFKNPSQKKPLDGAVGEFLIGWGVINRIFPIPVQVWRDSMPNEGGRVAGRYNKDGSIALVTYGRRHNLLRHRGGLGGTLMHELAHHLQQMGSDYDAGGWYWCKEHEKQNELFDKWKGQLGGFYAGSKPSEMTAEAFRVLQGFRSPEEWEKNEEFLEDFREFLGGNSIFSVFIR